MSDIEICFACQNSDRTRPLIDGRVKIEGVNLTWVAVDPEEIFHRAFRHEEFDVCEISLATHLTLTARGGSPYVGIPAFLSRAFRHNAIYIRVDGSVREPGDLRGARIGIGDYQQTAALWIRGLLLDQYGIHPREIRWHVGGLEEAGRPPRMPVDLSVDISATPLAPHETLSQMLLEGRLDAVISPRLPSCFVQQPDVIARLFPDFRSVEEAYFRETQFFPPMHVVGIRRSFHDRFPWLAASLFKALSAAKAIAMSELTETNYSRASLPWLQDDVARARSIAGADYWAYGIDRARHELEAMARYALTDGLAPRLVVPEELFAPSTLSMFRR